jgi:hypothetical protein
LYSYNEKEQYVSKNKNNVQSPTAGHWLKAEIVEALFVKALLR